MCIYVCICIYWSTYISCYTYRNTNSTLTTLTTLPIYRGDHRVLLDRLLSDSYSYSDSDSYTHTTQSNSYNKTNKSNYIIKYNSFELK